MQIIKLELSNEYMTSNSYILIKNKKCVVIDPSFNDNKLYDYISNNNLELTKIVLTHGHYDHWTGLEELLNKYPNTLVYASILDEYWFYNNPFTKYVPKVDHDLNYLNQINLLGLEFKIIKTPGHSKGSISLLLDNHLFSGDVLFYEGIGRYDLNGGNYNDLKLSILKLYQLDENIVIYPGHGKNTTIKHEKYNNPFINLNT